jgi:tetratricopeptide (TPR) repeat protein
MEAEDQIGSWTASQLSDYINGRMSVGDVHRLERDMLDDPFLDEAVEGYIGTGTGPDMQVLEEKWKARKTAGNGGSILSFIALGVAVLAFIAIGTMLFQETEIEGMADHVSQSMEETRVQGQIYSDSLEVMEIQLARIIVADKEIRPEATKEAQSAIKQQEEIREEQEQRMAPPKALPPLGFDSILDKQDKKVVKEPKPEVFYLHDFKLADHRPEYETELYIQGEWMSGTAARYEREQNGVIQIPDIVQVDYEGILSEAMAFFANRDYKSCLLVLKRIEKRHPNDANVAFYGGLCYYNLSKWSKADVYFRRALSHPIRVFDQESRWSLVLSLIDQEKFERARYHLRIIIEEREFYAERAQRMIRGL